MHILFGLNEWIFIDMLAVKKEKLKVPYIYYILNLYICPIGGISYGS